MYHEPGHQRHDHMHVTVVAFQVLANGKVSSEPNRSQRLPRGQEGHCAVPRTHPQSAEDHPNAKHAQQQEQGSQPGELPVRLAAMPAPTISWPWQVWWAPVRAPPVGKFATHFWLIQCVDGYDIVLTQPVASIASCDGAFRGCVAG